MVFNQMRYLIAVPLDRKTLLLFMYWKTFCLLVFLLSKIIDLFLSSFSLIFLIGMLSLATNIAAF